MSTFTILGRRTAVSMFVLMAVSAITATSQTLDYDVYKTSVQPIFLKKRPTHARCVVCHVEANHAFRLQRMDKDATTWNEEQTRKNFEMASKLVKPGDPSKSLLLRQPLAQDAGGEMFHSGGRQFTSKDDPDWKIIAGWVQAGK